MRKLTGGGGVVRQVSLEQGVRLDSWAQMLRFEAIVDNSICEGDYEIRNPCW